MFDDVRFPTAIARGATGGPERRTDVVTTASGREERNSRWAQSRRRYNVGFGVKTLADIHAVVSFFEERRGRLHAFRFRDAADWTSGAPGATPAATDQLLGTSDGTTATFQLVKRYGSGMPATALANLRPKRNVELNRRTPAAQDRRAQQAARFVDRHKFELSATNRAKDGGG